MTTHTVTGLTNDTVYRFAVVALNRPAFYGDDRDTAFAIAGGYRVRDWLEVGAEIGYSRDGGLGTAPDGSFVDAVDLKRWLFASSQAGAGHPRPPGKLYERSYWFFVVQSAETEIDGLDLGGETYRIGFRAEFELGR